MSDKYQGSVETGARLGHRATHFSHAGTIALVLMAALPAVLGLVHASFVDSTRAHAIRGQNAAATASELGNQSSNSVLSNGGKVTLGAKGEVLALCSGVSGAKPAARPSCTTLSLTISR